MAVILGAVLVAYLFLHQRAPDEAPQDVPLSSQATGDIAPSRA